MPSSEIGTASRDESSREALEVNGRGSEGKNGNHEPSFRELGRRAVLRSFLRAERASRRRASESEKREEFIKMGAAGFLVDRNGRFGLATASTGPCGL
jgi:hypothetical protein